MIAPHDLPPSAWPADTCGSPLLYPCDRCQRPGILLVVLGSKQVCLRCFRELGSPFSREEASAAALHLAETATRARMMERGGAFANAVRNGKT